MTKRRKKESDTTWHWIEVWGKQAEVVENYLKKGSEVAVEGKLTNRQQDDKNGEKHYITEIVVNSMLMLDKQANYILFPAEGAKCAEKNLN